MDQHSAAAPQHVSGGFFDDVNQVVRKARRARGSQVSVSCSIKPDGANNVLQLSGRRSRDL